MSSSGNQIAAQGSSEEPTERRLRQGLRLDVGVAHKINTLSLRGG